MLERITPACFPGATSRPFDVYNQTHSKELLKHLGCGKPWPTYEMLEKDISKARDTWSLDVHDTIVCAADNNQLKINSWDVKLKDTTVSTFVFQIKNYAPSIFLYI